jgi:hypothetical protein
MNLGLADQQTFPSSGLGNNSGDGKYSLSPNTRKDDVFFHAFLLYSSPKLQFLGKLSLNSAVLQG